MIGDMRVHGTVVAITGAARGIGYATAERLHRAGALVAIGDIDALAAEQAASELGLRCWTVLDVTSPSSFAAFLDKVEQDLGPVGVLVNNAGIMQIGPFVEESDDIASRMFAVNVLGSITGTKLALRRMLPRRRGHVVNVSSLVGDNAVPGAATYSGTKHAINGFTDGVRREYRGSGISFTVVMPTFTNTDLIAGTGKPPVFRNAEPGDIARAIESALRRPRPYVRVTRTAGFLSVLLRHLPRVIAEPLMRAAGTGRYFLADVDLTDRSRYDARVSGRIEDNDVRRSA